MTQETALYDIAIIGMTGRFPGAATVAEFWRNLAAGIESISVFSEQEVLAAGVDPDLVRQPNYIKAAGILPEIDLFDAEFFGYSPREAELMDPQQRIVLECAWEVLEDAGYNPLNYHGSIGVFVGSGANSYLTSNLCTQPDLIGPAEGFYTRLGNDKDFLATRISYKLNLRGPSFTVQTACSTSLVAVHVACQSLLHHECSMAIAGGISIAVPQTAGYLYQEGMIFSPDGHCRAFDADAQGTLIGSGVGLVVLKRLDDARADGDRIHAVIKGSAVNNDGASKVGYTAPSLEGQAAVIGEALSMAQVDPAHVSYVEAHGTATPLGDPVEIAALVQAFETDTPRSGPCAIGSVKTNIGHLDAAAGIAGLIKTVLALKHRQLPPSLHFRNPNPQIDFAQTFSVNTTLAPWESSTPLRLAGISSLGAGGTNAHMVLEEVPPTSSAPSRRPTQLLTIAARSPETLEHATANLIAHSRINLALSVADTAYTLQIGRVHFKHRRAIICPTDTPLIDTFSRLSPQQVVDGVAQADELSVLFMFPGGGAQYVDMGRGLYETEPLFRAEVDHCAEMLQARLGLDIRQLIYPTSERREHAAAQLRRTSLGLPALFIVEYALARLWMAWGIHPQGMIGHSLGEYVAACLAGVFSLHDALTLVTTRGRLFERITPGAMLSVALPEADVQALLHADLSLAAVNAPDSYVVAGAHAAIDELAAQLAERGATFRRINIEVAAHSHLVESILGEFTACVTQLELHAPLLPLISNVSGTWMTDEQATRPEYWVQHLRQTVRFADGIATILQTPQVVLLETGPGHTLTTLVKRQPEHASASAILNSTRHPADEQPDSTFLMTTLGKLWALGAKVDWSALYAAEQRCRIPLPSYPFERQRYWVEPRLTSTTSAHADTGRRPLTDWFYVPTWKRTLPPQSYPAEPTPPRTLWLVFVDSNQVGGALCRALHAHGQTTIPVSWGEQFACLDGSYTIDPRSQDDYIRLIGDLQTRGILPGRIIHCWGLYRTEHEPGPQRFEAAQQRGYYSLLYLSHALAEAGLIRAFQAGAAIEIDIIANELFSVSTETHVAPEKATVLGPCKIIPQEYPGVICRCIDVVLPEQSHQQEQLVGMLMTELASANTDRIVAYRDSRRWVQTFQRVDTHPLQSSTLRTEGVYLITGGLGDVGLLLAEHLARTVRARLVLVGRTGLPARDEWDNWIEQHPDQKRVVSRIQRLQAIEALGAEVMVAQADVANIEQMRSVFCAAEARFGTIRGILHAAGVLHGRSIYAPATEIGHAESEEQFGPKVQGLYVLDQLFHERTPDFCLLFSSNAAILGGLGFVAYAAANAFMDAFAAQRAPSLWISANWDSWPMSESRSAEARLQTSMSQFAMTADEACAAFDAVVRLTPMGHVIVSAGDLLARARVWIDQLGAEPTGVHAATTAASHPRPKLAVAYDAPKNETECKVAAIWQELLGIEQIGLHDNFFALGGHSLLATRVISRINGTFQINLPLRSFFEGPTIAELTMLLTQQVAEQVEDDVLERVLAEIEQLPDDPLS